jgi:2-polyprenyl-3-methyl-5-hydroxy-6-metoxy-1,4-benzoquinol methylase
MPYPICPESEVLRLLEMQDVPVFCNVLWPSRDEALNVSRGTIRLGYFPACGHVYNLDFDSSLLDYNQQYENSLHFSPTFQQFATELAQGLVGRYNLRGKRIMEIGAGKGDFLLMLCEIGGNLGWGFDASYVPDEARTAENVTFIQAFDFEQHPGHNADLIVCRHVLEHIEDPDAFVAKVRRMVGGRKDTVVFFEVPNSLWTLRQLGIWDIIYEHCSYFSPQSLAAIFERNGFEVLALNEVFGGQFLTIEAVASGKWQVAGGGGTEEQRSRGAEEKWAVGSERSAVGGRLWKALPQVMADALAFSDNYRRKRDAWRQKLEALAAENRNAVVWGAGSKGVTFMNALNASDAIEYVVDINPRKQGKYVSGTGQEIVSPQFLRTYRPEVVIIMNANYRDEIGRMLEGVGVKAELLVA